MMETVTAHYWGSISGSMLVINFVCKEWIHYKGIWWCLSIKYVFFKKCQVIIFSPRSRDRVIPIFDDFRDPFLCCSQSIPKTKKQSTQGNQVCQYIAKHLIYRVFPGIFSLTLHKGCLEFHVLNNTQSHESDSWNNWYSKYKYLS
jgi:hypothetical protein